MEEEKYYIDWIIDLYQRGCRELVLKPGNSSDEAFIECRPRSASAVDIWVEDLDGVMKYGVTITYDSQNANHVDTVSYYMISYSIKPILAILQKKIDYKHVIKSLDLA